MVLEEYMNLQLKEVPVPEIGEHEVLIKVEAVGICGSDVHGLDGSTGRRIPPIIMGHEASGIIEKKGGLVGNWQVGDRVTFDSTIYNPEDWYSKNSMYNLSDGRMVLGVSCNEFRRQGAFAEYVAIPEHILYKIPATVSFTEAALVEPAAVALHAIQLSPLQKDDVVTVFGAGMVGMFVIQLLKIKGCRNVIAVDLEENRLKLATSLGADFAFRPDDPRLEEQISKLTEGRGADIAFEVVGISATMHKAIDMVRKGASIIVVGNLSPSIDLPLQKIVTRQLRLQGSCAINGEYPEILELIANGKLNVTAILSAEVPLDEGPIWFNRLYQQEKGLMKVILKP